LPFSFSFFVLSLFLKHATLEKESSSELCKDSPQASQIASGFADVLSVASLMKVALPLTKTLVRLSIFIFRL